MMPSIFHMLVFSGAGFELRDSHTLARQLLYHLSHSASPHMLVCHSYIFFVVHSDLLPISNWVVYFLIEEFLRIFDIFWL
jgi:hypothetical protein